MVFGLAVPALAQRRLVETVSGQWIRAHVITTSNSGRFWITSGPDIYHLDSVRFLFATDASFVTSNLVFRVQRGNSVIYYHNQPLDYFSAWRPTPAETGVSCAFKPYDSMYVSKDTLLMRWRGIAGFTIFVRFIAEKQSTEYDTGGDLVMEFQHVLENGSPDGNLGILMMLDTYNSQAAAISGGGISDYPSVLTSLGYHPVDAFQNSAKYTQPNMPEWYHVGNFRFTDPLNDVFPVHRLSGFTHGGLPLTAPNMLAIGNWVMLRSVAWDLPPEFPTSGFGDCATVTRWEGLHGTGIVRTAFGLSDKGANNLFTCRDDGVFIDVRAPRIVAQKVKGGPYNPPYVDVEVWVTNTDESYGMTPTIRLQSPLPSMPSLRNDRLILDSTSTPASQFVFLQPKQTKKLTWRLNINPTSLDSTVQLIFRIKQVNAREHVFAEGCRPLITVRGWYDPPPPPDTLAPVIELTSSGRAATQFWNFKIYDRHPNYLWDKGLRSPLTVLSSNNVSVVQTPSLFPGCDTTQTVLLAVQVVDTTKPASYTFNALDCAGNDSVATVVFGPRPDTFPPEVVLLENSGSLGPPCNARHYRFDLVDQNHQTATAGDYGFGSVQIASADNFRVTINNGQPILPFQRVVPVTADVVDTMRDGSLMLLVLDYAGNSTIVTYAYCTLPDILPPVSNATVASPGRWQVDAGDQREWDRGLRDIVEIGNSNGNLRFEAPPAVNPGDRTSTFYVVAGDITQPGSMTIEIRDMIYASKPLGHADTLTIDYDPGVPPPTDTLAPNIVFTPMPGSTGTTADVEVNDIHKVDGLPYRYDTGLRTVVVSYTTPNIRLASPISFLLGDTVTHFRVEIIDTLAIETRDTICITATDTAGNVSTNCYVYPTRPDTLAPLLVGALDLANARFDVELSDDRPYDRGLGDVTIVSPVNVVPNASVTRGAKRMRASFSVPDPTSGISGTFLLRDLVATIETSSEQQEQHLVRVPFTLSRVELALVLPDKIDGGRTIAAAIVARRAFTTDVDSLMVDLTYAGSVQDPTVTWRLGTLGPTSISGGRVQLRADLGIDVKAGDTLGTLNFRTSEAKAVQKLTLTLLGAAVNGNSPSVITVLRGADTGRSILTLPPPVLTVATDSVTYINGTCERVLVTNRMAKATALSIVAVKPLPVVQSSGSLLEVDIRNLTAQGAVAELIALDGTTAATVSIPGDLASLVRRALNLPPVPAGTYFLRITAASGVDQVKVVVAE